jgi:hypothetical protein
MSTLDRLTERRSTLTDPASEFILTAVFGKSQDLACAGFVHDVRVCVASRPRYWSL